jgi:hypothetical protein
MERGNLPSRINRFLAHESFTVLRPEAMAMATCGFVLADSYGGVDATCA